MAVSVPGFESLPNKASRLFRAGDVSGADRCMKAFIAKSRAEYEEAKIAVNDGRGSFEMLEHVRRLLEAAEDAYAKFHETVG
jgi:hypothetical protein